MPERKTPVCSQACVPRQSSRAPASMWRHGLAARMAMRKRPHVQSAVQAEHSDEADAQPEAGSVMLTSDQRTLPYKVILALAAGGIAETAYLTLVSERTGGSLEDSAFIHVMLHVKWCSWCNAASGLPGILVMCLHLCLQSKLLAAPVACPLSGSCDTVLSSGYAELFGVPLSAFGASWHGGPGCWASCCRPMPTAFAYSGTMIGILQLLNPGGHPCLSLGVAGLAAYSAAAVTAFLGLREAVAGPTARLALLATSTVLASCSSYLL